MRHFGYYGGEIQAVKIKSRWVPVQWNPNHNNWVTGMGINGGAYGRTPEAAAYNSDAPRYKTKRAAIAALCVADDDCYLAELV